MASHAVPVIEVEDIIEHPNADALELAIVGGWQTAVRKGLFAKGSRAVYIPVDSVLSEELGAQIFPPDSKVKLNSHRVRAARIRGEMSFGFIIDESSVDEPYRSAIRKAKVGDDLAKTLGVTKYEPPEPNYQGPPHGPRDNRRGNPWLEKYTDIENFENYVNLFEEGELVYISEKMHGTSARYGVLPRTALRGWRKILKPLYNLLGHGEYEFVYGSRNVQLQYRKKMHYDGNVYAEAGKALDLESVLEPGEVLYGEVVGRTKSGGVIQKGYDYGYSEPKLFAYDVMSHGRYLSPSEFRDWCEDRAIPMVPVVYIGAFERANADFLRNQKSKLKGDLLAEGIVIKPIEEQWSRIGRKVLKWVSSEFRLKAETDWH